MKHFLADLPNFVPAGGGGGGGIEFIESIHTYVDNATSGNLTFSETPANDEFLLFFTRYNQTSTSSCSELTKLFQANGHNGFPKFSTFYRVASSEANAIYPFSFTASIYGSIIGMRFTGVDTSTPFDATYVTGTGWYNMLCPSITTITDGAWHIAASGGGDVCTATTPSGYTSITPSGSTECLVAYKEITSAGATGTAEIGTDNETFRLSLALRPA